jgi:hypothetical protein
MSALAIGAAVPGPEVRMADQIAAHFRLHPEEHVAAEVVTHPLSFRTPRPTERPSAIVESGEADVDPLLRRVVVLLRSTGR